MRRRLVSPLLPGGNVLVQKGRDPGGDFRNIRASLDPYFATAPFPGPLGAVTDKPPGSVSTRWVSMPGRYGASCRREAGAAWLGVTPEPGDPRPAVTERIGPDWGLHLYDANLALGNLVEVARRQAKAYARR